MISFNYYLPTNIVFGCGKANQVGELTKPYGKKAFMTGLTKALLKQDLRQYFLTR
jgi:alcohol dehydrogenase YqhD (iron-dependent ADH family)